jgi:hypothetical protein
MKSGGNEHFRHETPKVIANFFSPMVETPLNINIQSGNTVYFKQVKIDVFSAENISLYALFHRIFQH